MFLRARREALHPADVGLLDNGRRRTPGLRREEVAALAGVSIDYLTRIEQGRDVNPSASVLAALAAALRLGDGERTHLAKLAAMAHSPELCPEATPLADDVAPGVRHLIDQLSPTPAFVVGPIGDIVARNDAWERVVAALGMLDDPTVNLARYVFLDPCARPATADWDAAADEQVARTACCRTAMGRGARVRRAPRRAPRRRRFVSRWSTHPVAEKRRGTKELEHPEVGNLRLAFEVLLLADDDQQLVTWRAADDTSAARLVALVPTPGP